MTKSNWDTSDQGITESSPYISELREKMNRVVDLLKGNLGDVYITKILNSICQITNDHFVNALFKVKRISDKGN